MKDLMWGLKALAQMLVMGVLFTLAVLTIRWWGPILATVLTILFVIAGFSITWHELKTGKKFPKTDAEIY